MGNGACLLVDDKAIEAFVSDHEEDQCHPKASHHVAKMVEDFTNGLAKEVGSQVNNPLFVDRPDYSGPVLQPIRATFGVSMSSCDVSEERVAENVVPCNESEGQPSGVLEATRLTRVAKGSGMQRTRSCPPRVRRPTPSGPWSLEWLQDHRHGDARVIFSSRKRAHNLNCPGVSRQQAEHKGSKKRKGGGPLCHIIPRGEC
jgi:hypothetical protein